LKLFYLYQSKDSKFKTCGLFSEIPALQPEKIFPVAFLGMVRIVYDIYRRASHTDGEICNWIRIVFSLSVFKIIQIFWR